MKSDIIFSSLIKLGFTEIQARIYTALVETKKPSITSIAKKLGIQRATTYQGLKVLQEHGLVEIKENYAREITPESPTKILSLLKSKQTEFNTMSEELNYSLPDILRDFDQNSRKPQVKFYKGKSSFVTLLDEIVSESSEHIYHVGSSKMLELIPEYMPTYIKNRVKKGVQSHSITFSEIEILSRNHQTELRPIRYLDPKYSGNSAFMVYGNKVAIWNTVLPQIITIEDQVIADFFKTIYDIIWDEKND